MSCINEGVVVTSTRTREVNDNYAYTLRYIYIVEHMDSPHRKEWLRMHESADRPP